MRAATLALCLCVAACAHQAELPIEPLTLFTLDGQPKHWQDIVARDQFTVLIFVSAECQSLAAHTFRLSQLAAQYAPRGIQFLAVDSEIGTSPSVAAAEARAYRLPFPLFIDSGAQLANSFAASYATYTVVVDRKSNVHYRGGLDSDLVDLHDNAKLYVRDALDDLLAGREPRLQQTKTLGCILRKS